MKDYEPTKGFRPQLLYVSATGNRVMSEDPAYIKWRKEENDRWQQENDALVESARKKLTTEEFEAVQSLGADY